MNVKLIGCIVTLFISAIAAFAQVPDTINYQGRLIDTNGTPVNGSVNVDVAVYTNISGGAGVYFEQIGQLPIQEGTYSFGWGSSGTLIWTSTETLGVSDGATMAYSYNIANPPILPGTLEVDDGIYTWDEDVGSSAPSEFDVTSFDYATGFVRANYFSSNFVPSAGTVINVTYQYPRTGISDVLPNYPGLYQESVSMASPSRLAIN
ncbi:MAG: hypothetical protein GKR87_03180 [Kiritimatiellae bacterium]|nr:hypothetical protein [Kiritimatiellia bacterium]